MDRLVKHVKMCNGNVSKICVELDDCNAEITALSKDIFGRSNSWVPIKKETSPLFSTYIPNFY